MTQSQHERSSLKVTIKISQEAQQNHIYLKRFSTDTNQM